MTLPHLSLATALILIPAAHPSAPAPAALNDAQIAHIAVTANQLDVAAARQALDKSKNPAVRAFAETMVRDHEGVIKQAVALAKRLGVTPEDNDTSRSLTTSADATRERLSHLSGAAFDKAYMDNEVAYHQAVIDAVENTLIPNTQNAELKKLLESVVPALKAHLQQARTVVSGLKG